MSELQHKFVTTNGIRMHYVEQVTGLLVLLCHGFPESWYSWRHSACRARRGRLPRHRARPARIRADRTAQAD